MRRSLMTLAGALALLLAACAGGPPPEPVWRNGAGVPVDARYGTPLPGSQPLF